MTRLRSDRRACNWLPGESDGPAGFCDDDGRQPGAFILHFAAGSGQVAVGGDTGGGVVANPPSLGIDTAFAQKPTAVALNPIANHHSPLVTSDIAGQVFGDLGPSLTPNTLFGQPDAILDAAVNEQTGSLAPAKAWLEPLGALQCAFASPEMLQPDGQARHNALGGLNDPDQDGRDEIFAPEEASDSIICIP